MAEQQVTPVFPKAYADKMMQAVLEFNPRDLPPELKYHKDAAELAFTARQLEFMRPGIIETAYPMMKGKLFVPVNTNANPGHATYTTTIMNHVGQAARGADLKNGDMPRVDVSTTQVTVAFTSYYLSYGYSIEEARAAIVAQLPLPVLKAMACRMELERQLDTTIMLGDSVVGSKGFLTQSSAASYTVVNGGGGAKNFELKTSDEINFTLTSATSKVVTDSKGTLAPDTMVLPYSSYEFIAGKRVGDGTSDTVLSYFLKTNPHITSIDSSHLAESNSGWTGKRGTVYKKDPTCLEAVVSQPFEQYQPQLDGLETVTICHLKTAGTVLLQPLTMEYFDQI